MLMNPQLEGILTNEPEDGRSASPAPVHQVPRTLAPLVRRTRLLMTLLPVPLYCGIEAAVGIENANSLWALLLTPAALLWYAIEYLLFSALARRIIKEVTHYGIFLTPPITLFVAGLQPAGEAWPLAKTMLLWGEFSFCSLLAVVLWRDRKTAGK